MFSCYENITLRNIEHILCTPCISNCPYNVTSDSDVRYTRSTIEIIQKRPVAYSPRHLRYLQVVMIWRIVHFRCCEMLCKSLFSLRRRAIEFQRIRIEGGKAEQEEIKEIYIAKTPVAVVHNISGYENPWHRNEFAYIKQPVH